MLQSVYNYLQSAHYVIALHYKAQVNVIDGFNYRLTCTIFQLHETLKGLTFTRT